jgi:hypothetical protein
MNMSKVSLHVAPAIVIALCLHFFALPGPTTESFQRFTGIGEKKARCPAKSTLEGSGAQNFPLQMSPPMLQKSCDNLIGTVHQSEIAGLRCPI